MADGAGRVLIGERADTPGGWQFPQGGIEADETAFAALVRELWEELHLAAGSYRVEAEKGPYSYLFPPGRTKHGFNGQEQRYFLLTLTVPAASLDFQTEAPEFRAIRWIRPAEFSLSWLPEMKRDVYRQVIRDFFDLLVH